MTTSQEHLEWLNGQIPPAESPLPEAGDPGPLSPEAIAQHRRSDELSGLLAMANTAVNYQMSTLQLLAGYAMLFKYFRDALTYLQPKDMELRKGFREDLMETLAGIERDMRAQQPAREAAE